MHTKGKAVDKSKYVPNFLIKWVGRMKRKEVQIDWREKFAINLIIWMSIAGVMFFMGELKLHDVVLRLSLTYHSWLSGTDLPSARCLHVVRTYLV